MATRATSPVCSLGDDRLDAVDVVGMDAAQPVLVGVAGRRRPDSCRASRARCASDRRCRSRDRNPRRPAGRSRAQSPSGSRCDRARRDHAQHGDVLADAPDAMRVGAERRARECSANCLSCHRRRLRSGREPWTAKRAKEHAGGAREATAKQRTGGYGAGVRRCGPRMRARPAEQLDAAATAAASAQRPAPRALLGGGEMRPVISISAQWLTALLRQRPEPPCGGCPSPLALWPKSPALHGHFERRQNARSGL